MVYRHGDLPTVGYVLLDQTSHQIDMLFSAYIFDYEILSRNAGHRVRAMSVC
jgi:hypothetical protein